MIDQEENLRNTVKWKKRPVKRLGTPLGESLRKLLEEEVLPKQKKLKPVVTLWKALLPENLQSHCRIDELKGGQLRVKVDLPAYRQELDWCKAEILEQIKEHCPQSRVKEIKIVVG